RSAYGAVQPELAGRHRAARPRAAAHLHVLARRRPRAGLHPRLGDRPDHPECTRLRRPGHFLTGSWESGPMLTIGELASYAGVTVRAVRHYHAKGLLPEPERDHSGYRRYGAAAVV